MVNRVVLAAGFIAVAMSYVPAGSLNATGPSALAAHADPSPAVTLEHRYRILGKVRLAFVWAGRDVGSARLTWQSGSGTSALSLLAGSDPEVAPRRLNQWTYLREEVRGDLAEVFSARTLPSADTGAGPMTLGRGSRFGVSCAAISTGTMVIARTELDAAGVTYQMFPQFLDRISPGALWLPRRGAYPKGVHPGFLTALRHVLESDSHAVRTPPLPSIAYLFNDTVYDLRVSRRRPLGPVTVGTRSFDHLTRADFVVRNRSTRDETTFGLTYEAVPGQPRLPVQIFFQPSFWLAVELRLDDAVTAPAEPSADAVTLARIRGVCGAANGAGPLQ